MDIGSQIQGLEMKLRNQVFFVNAGVVGGLLLAEYRGAPGVLLLPTGFILIVIVNAIFALRWRSRRVPQDCVFCNAYRFFAPSLS